MENGLQPLLMQVLLLLLFGKLFKFQTMLKYSILSIIIMSFSSYGQEIQKLYSKEKLIQVFTTAENTDLRLTPTNNLNFICKKKLHHFF